MMTVARCDLLALDPSSHAVGYACFDGSGSVVAFGVVRPPRARMPAAGRIDALVAGVATLCDRHGPARAVVEFSAGKVARRVRGRSAGAGLAVLGQAQGAIRQYLAGRLGPDAVAIAGEGWTGGEPKHRRAARAALLVPGYAGFRVGGGDPGGDAGDAIGLGDFHLSRLREAELLDRAGRRGGG